MIFLRLCAWKTPLQRRRSLSSFNLALLHRISDDFKRAPCPSILCRLECNRTFSITNHLKATHRNPSKADQLARSRPRLMKEYDAQKKKDKMSVDWDLIFTSKKLETKLVIAHWISLACLCVTPFLAVYNMLELEHEDNVVFGSFTIAKTTEFAIFILVNTFIMTVILKNVRSMPKRIYYNERTGDYLALCRAWSPLSTVRKQFKAHDIKHIQITFIPPQYRFFKINDYLVSNRRLLFPHLAFRSGEDRHWLLRYVE